MKGDEDGRRGRRKDHTDRGGNPRHREDVKVARHEQEREHKLKKSRRPALHQSKIFAPRTKPMWSKFVFKVLHDALRYSRPYSTKSRFEDRNVVFSVVNIHNSTVIG